jgi:hypothetical protein
VRDPIRLRAAALIGLPTNKSKYVGQPIAHKGKASRLFGSVAASPLKLPFGRTDVQLPLKLSANGFVAILNLEGGKSHVDASFNPGDSNGCTKSDR